MLSAAAQLSFQLGRVKEAAALIQRSFAGVDLTRSSMPMREGHLTAYRIYRAVGQADVAIQHLEALKRLDDEATKLATQTSTALMGARFDYANQELRIAKLKAEELRRSVLVEQERARTQRIIFVGVGIGALIVLGLLLAGLVALRRSRDEVRVANDDLGVTNAALGKALAAKTEFLATTSHEIRTPLNAILGLTEVMLVDRTLPEAARDRLELVHGAGITMRALVNDILDVAKIETGRLTVELAGFDLAGVLRDAAHLWEDQVRARGIAFDVVLDLPPGPVLGDAARVRQVVFNLLSNAAKFTEGGSITLGAVRRGSVVDITVRDTGLGIAPDQVDEIFESFRQADASTTRRFGGSGLGLSISRNLARAMGGELAVASRPGEGSTFTFTLPVVDHVEMVSSSALPEQGEALLVIDRNPIMRALYRTLLAPYVDRVLLAGTVDEAIAAIDAGAPATILVDEDAIGDGADRLAAATPAIAVTVLRASDTAAFLPSSFRVLTKPITGPGLVAAMFPDKNGRRESTVLETRAA